MSDSLQAQGLHRPWYSPGQNTGVHNLSLLQGTFPTQGSTPGLPHCRQILYQLGHEGSPCARRMPGLLLLHGASTEGSRAELRESASNCVGPFHDPSLTSSSLKIFSRLSQNIPCLLKPLRAEFLSLGTQSSRTCIPCLTNVMSQYNALSTGLSFLLDFKFCEERA